MLDINERNKKTVGFKSFDDIVDPITDIPKEQYKDNDYRKYLNTLFQYDEKIKSRIKKDLEIVEKSGEWKEGWHPKTTLLQRISFEHDQIYESKEKYIDYLITQTEYDVLNNTSDMYTDDEEEKNERIRLVLLNIMRIMIKKEMRVVGFVGWIKGSSYEKDKKARDLVMAFQKICFPCYSIFEDKWQYDLVKNGKW